MEGWLHGVAASGFSDEPTPATALHHLIPFAEAEQHPSTFIQAFLHHAFPRSPHAVPLQAVPKTEIVQSHYLQGSRRDDDGNKKTAELAKINLGSAPAILAIGPGVWTSGLQLYDVFGLRKAAALYATQPRAKNSSPIDIDGPHGKARWTYITHLIDSYLTFTPPGRKADGRKTNSASVWLLRKLDHEHHVVKEGKEEVGILVIFLAGSKEEEHARRVEELGGERALTLHPEQHKLKFLIHGLLKFADANGIDKLGWTYDVKERDFENRVPITVKGAHVFNAIMVYGELRVNYSLPLGRRDMRSVEVTGMNLQPARYVGARYLGQSTDNTPANRAISSQWVVNTGTERRFWGSAEYIITFEN